MKVAGAGQKVISVDEGQTLVGLVAAPYCRQRNRAVQDNEPVLLRELWLLGLADPVHLDDDDAFAADVGQVDEHQRPSLDGAQPRRLARELSPVEEDHRLADGQFPGHLTDRCRGGMWQPVEQVIGDGVPSASQPPATSR